MGGRIEGSHFKSCGQPRYAAEGGARGGRRKKEGRPGGGGGADATALRQQERGEEEGLSDKYRMNVGRPLSDR